MRLRSLTLERYAVFERVTVPLDVRTGQVNLVVAPNGAGKSVLVAAFADLLFGIHPSSEMKFRFDDYKGMRLQAEAVVDGAPVTLVRRKGQGNTLAGADNRPIDPALLQRWMGSITSDKRLLSLFALDSHRLRAAEGLLLNTDGDLAQALLSGTGALRSARELRETLVRRRDAIGKRGSSKPPLNEAMAQWAAYGDELRRAIVAPEQHAAAVAQLEKAMAAKLEADGQHAAALAELKRLARLQATQPAAAARQAALDGLAELGSGVLPDPAVAERLDHVELNRIRAGDAVVAARQRALQSAGAAAAHVVPSGLLAAGEAIDTAGAALGAAQKARDDSPAQERERDLALEQAGHLLVQLGWTAAPEAASALLPSRAAVLAAQTALVKRDGLRTALGDKTDELTAAREAAGRSAGELAATLLADAPAGLDGLVAEIRAAAPVAQREAAESAVAAAAAALEAALASVPGWRRDAAALLGLAVPERLGLEAARRALDGAAAALDGAHVRLAEAKAAEAQLQADLTAHGADTPDEAALRAARERRDAGWHLVRARLAGQPGDEAAYDARSLPDAVEDAIAVADQVADLRFKGAERLAAAAGAAVRLREAQAQAQARRDTVVDAEAVAAGAAGAWAAVVEPMGLAGDAALDDVRALLSARAVAVAAREKLRVAQAAASRLAAHHAGWAARLPGDGELTARLAAAEQVLGAVQQSALARGLAERQAAQDAEALRLADAAQVRAAADDAGWRSDWAGHLLALRRDAAEPVEVTAGLLTLFEELRDATTAARLSADRVTGMAAVVDSFQQRARAARAAAGGEAGDDSFADVKAMLAALVTGRALALAAGHDVDTARQDAAALGRVQAASEEADCELRAVLALCGAADVAQARLRLEAARRRRQLLDARDEAERRILDAGAGMALPALLAEAAAVLPGDLAALRDAADERAGEQSDLKTKAAVRASELRQQLGADDAAGATVTLASTRQAMALATVERTLEEALTLHLAIGMLDSGLQAVESAGGDAGLERIGALFRTLTAGAYSAVEAADVNGAARLRAVDAAWPKERKTMAQLSEGTRDQLCLALRLAAIEDHVRDAPALPFLGDDILQTFDDTRARAALQALVGLSEHVQVIVLTHHPHLAGLAEGLPVHLARL